MVAALSCSGATMQANNLVAQAGMQDNANYWGAINAGIGAVGNVLKPTPGLPKAV